MTTCKVKSDPHRVLYRESARRILRLTSTPRRSCCGITLAEVARAARMRHAHHIYPRLSGLSSPSIPRSQAAQMAGTSSPFDHAWRHPLPDSVAGELPARGPPPGVHRLANARES